MAAHTPEQLAQEHRRYLQVFAWLAGLTVIEIAVIYTPLPHFVIGLMLVMLAASKASMVALFYMHLAFEKRTLTYIALTPAALCVLLLFALLPDLGAITRALTHAAPVAAAPAEH